MLFVNVLSLFYLTHLVLSQTVSEGEAINKIIGDIFIKAEKKNAEPIQFCWKNRITADGQLSTPSYNKISSPMQQELLDLEPEPFLKKIPEKTAIVATLGLKDIIPEYRETDLQPIRDTTKKFKGSDDKATYDFAATTKSHKGNHLSKPRAHYKLNPAVQNSESTPGISKASTPFSTTDRQFKESLVTPFKQIATVTQSTQSKNNNNPLRTSSAEAAEDIFANEFRYNDDSVKTNKEKIVKIHQKNKGHYNTGGRNAHENIKNIGNQKHVIKPSTQLTELNDIENAVNSVPNYEAATTESMEEFMKRILKQKDKTDLKNYAGDERNAETAVAENPKPSKKHELVDLYKSILELYGDTKGSQAQLFKEDGIKKHQKFHEKIKKHVNWEAIKRFFGHSRVCGCKCKANKTMCRVCAESDAVIRELTFEFNNLAEYMREHCTEIQSYFWKNPSGGKKLRDSVHKIDNTMQNYFKRVRGQCEGRTCKTFTSYLDKRRNVKQTKVDKERLRELMRELGITDLE